MADPTKDDSVGRQSRGVGSHPSPAAKTPGGPLSVNLAEGIALSHKLMRFTGAARKA